MTREDQPTLAVPSDDRESAEQLSMFALRGQLALPGAGAQLGLDRVAYATPATQECDPLDSDRSPERASPSLGSYTEFCEERGLPLTEGPLGGQLPLPLDLDRFDKAPQLSLFGRQQVVRALFPRGSEYERDAKCGWTRFATDTDVTLHRSNLGRFSTGNLIRCNQFQSCPACGQRKCREAASKLAVCIERHLRRSDVDADVWMLTLTIPHYVDTSTIDVVDQLYAASALFYRDRDVRRFLDRWGIEARVRVLDNVQGATNGAHPHFHVLLFPTAAGLPTTHAWLLGVDEKGKASSTWVVDERGAESREGVRVLPVSLRDALDEHGPWTKLSSCSKVVREKFLDEIRGPLVDAWERALLAAGTRISDRETHRAIGVRLTPSEKAASYVVKWGLGDEVGAPTAKRRNHLRLLDAVAADVPGAAYNFKLWRRATAGRTLVTGLTDTCRRIGVTDEDALAYVEEMQRRREREAEREGKPIVKVPELRLIIRSHVYAAAQALGFDAVCAFVNEVAERGRGEAPDWVQRELDAFLWRHMGLVRNSDTS